MKKNTKENRGKYIGVTAFMVMMLCVLAACGKKNIDVTESLTVKFEGCNGYGIAELENEYGWEDDAFEAAGIDSIDSFSSLADGLAIESAVSYEVFPNENLSNGDKVTVKATFSNETVENYNIKFTSKERTFTVEGLPEVKQVDLFENIEVEFNGIAPNAKASVIDASSDHYVMTTYKLDKDSNLNVGDFVTVTAKYDQKKLLENGYMAESDTKQFAVSEVAKYVNSFEEISEEAWIYLEKECSDFLEAKFATSNSYYHMFARAASNDNNSNLYNNYLSTYNALEWGTRGEKLAFEKPQYELTHVYLLETKNMGSLFSAKNKLIMLYTVHVRDNAAGEADAYIPIYFNNILLNADGSNYVDISTIEISNSSFNIDTVYNSNINANKADWNIIEREIKDE